MALADVLTSLTARRDRFRELLAVKNVEVAADASLLQCLDALAAYFGVVVGDPEDLYPTVQITSNVIVLSNQYFVDGVLTPVTAVSGIDEECTSTYWDGTEFQTVSGVYIPARGEHVQVTLPDTTARQIVLTYGTQTDTIDYQGYKIPCYFKRPSGEGNYRLEIDGSLVELEVYHAGAWQDVPAEGLSADYARDFIRTKTEVTKTQAMARWENGGVYSDPFWYVI